MNRSALNVEEEDERDEVRDGVVMEGGAFSTEEWNSKGGAERLRYRSMVVGRGVSLCGFKHYCLKEGLPLEKVRRGGFYISRQHSSHDIFTSTAKDRWMGHAKSQSKLFREEGKGRDCRKIVKLIRIFPLQTNLFCLLFLSDTLYKLS